MREASLEQSGHWDGLSSPLPLSISDSKQSLAQRPAGPDPALTDSLAPGLHFCLGILATCCLLCRLVSAGSQTRPRPKPVSSDSHTAGKGEGTVGPMRMGCKGPWRFLQSMQSAKAQRAFWVTSQPSQSTDGKTEDGSGGSKTAQ